MPTFTLDGVSYEYLQPDLGGELEGVRSWEYGKWPKVHVRVPLAGGAVAEVYGRASRWTAAHIHVNWQDDSDHFQGAWVPAANVRKATESEWDIEEYRRTPENLRMVQWGHRFPGFLPE